MLIVPALLSTLFLSTLLGCSSSGSATTTATDTPGGLAAGLADSFCLAQAACCGTAGATTDAGGTTVACLSDAGVAPGLTSTCQDRATLTANQQLALVATAFSEGLLTINPDVATACTAAYQTSLTCAVLASQGLDAQAALELPACAGIFTGYIPVGERCDMSAECISGSFCLSQGSGQAATSLEGSGTLGVCFPYQQVGDPCNTTDDCLPPLGCNQNTLTCG